jgi:glycerol-3-phosphate dehydrogenase (NAD(P)+)
LGSVLGGARETFVGLAGIGDLVVTCFSAHSRNRAVGFRLGSGEKVGAVLDSMEQVAEGVPTCQAVHELFVNRNIELPITETVYRIVHDGLPVEEGVEILLTRRPEEE